MSLTGNPIKKYTVIPLKEPVVAPEPKTTPIPITKPAPAMPTKEPERVG